VLLSQEAVTTVSHSTPLDWSSQLGKDVKSYWVRKER